ncbi:MAG: alpha/beta hydrolase [Planctomycetaceae bacterium]|jgi:acetyl esterase/lipase
MSFSAHHLLSSRLLYLLLLCVSAAPSALQGEERVVEGLKYLAEYQEDDAHQQKRCQLSLYLPEKEQGFATVVWFHGGGLTGGNPSIPAALRGRGIAVAAAGYRLSPNVAASVCIQDAAAATAWVIKNIASWGGDPKRVFVAGHSAGGYLTMMVGMDQRWLGEHQIKIGQIAGLIPFSGHAITHFTVRKERGIADTTPIVDEFAPLFHVRRDLPPMLLITGDRKLELLARYEENAYLLGMLQQVKHPDVELHELGGFNHGQMAEPAFPLLVRFIQRVSRE